MGLWHEIEKSVGKWIENADKQMREWNMPDIHIGYDSNKGINANINTNNNINGNIGNAGKYKPGGYSRTAAATAKDIAQGGMTKDEVIEFNMKHPNETAQRSE